MSMWRLPEGAAFVGDESHKHPSDKTGDYYYRLVRFEATGIYSMLGMGGEIRSCPRQWAEEVASSCKG